MADSDLPRYSWDEARERWLWPPDAFGRLGIKPATIRKWASRGHIKAAGKGPRGCRLYRYAEVVRHAERA
jgi:hypothetical protein